MESISYYTSYTSYTKSKNRCCCGKSYISYESSKKGTIKDDSKYEKIIVYKRGKKDKAKVIRGEKQEE